MCRPPLSSYFLLPLFLSGMLLMSACQSKGPNVGVTAGEIEANPEQYYGQRVVVSGDIDDVYSSSFTIGGQGFQDELLVVVPEEAQVSGGRSGEHTYEGDDIVQVTGSVRRYVVTQIEEEYGVGLDGAEIDYDEQEPVLIAESVAITPRTGTGTRTDTTGETSQQRDREQTRSAQNEGPAVTDGR